VNLTSVSRTLAKGLLHTIELPFTALTEFRKLRSREVLPSLRFSVSPFRLDPGLLRLTLLVFRSLCSSSLSSAS
jgi:hypothetical protein